MKRKVKTIQDVNALPLTQTTIASTPRFGLKAFEREEQRVKDVEAKRAREAQDQTTRLFWSRPLTIIGQDGVDAVGAFDDIGLWTVETRDVKSDVATFNEFIKTLSTTGITLSQSGLQRLGSFAEVQAQHGVNITPDALKKIFDRLCTLNCFAEGEVTGIVEQRTEEPTESRPTFADIEKLDTSTRAGEASARKLLTELYFKTEAREVFFRFLRHLYDTWGFSPSEYQQREMCLWFVKHNRSMSADKDAWNSMRLAMVKRGIFPEVGANGKPLILPEEQFSEAIENTTIPLTDYNARQDFIARTKSLIQ